MCISETKLKIDSTFEIKNYTFIHKPQILQEGEIAKGGTGIFIRKDTPFSKIDLQSNFKVVAIQLHLHKKVTLCSIYIPPNTPISQHDLENLIRKQYLISR